MRNQKGFTLIELIMVIVILGILAAIIVPRFFDFTEDAHKASLETFVGNLKSGLEINAARNILESGYRAFPKGSELVIDDLLDQIPNEWSTGNPNGDDIDFIYTGDGTGDVVIRYNCAGGSGESYTLTLIGDKYGWSDGHTF